MRRTNVILDEKLLEEAHRKSGQKTYSATINRALQELVRRMTFEENMKIISGSNAWEGDLEQMRRGRDFDFPDTFSTPLLIRDAPAPVTKSRRSKRRRGSR
jgi:Arc/MetJ family transcription regulator